MVKKPAAIPDAWDDDWEAQADRLKPEDKAPESEPSPPRSKSERLAQHVEANRKLWESAYVCSLARLITGHHRR
jgi:hypothetical protein